jgi:hypothetical protein
MGDCRRPWGRERGFAAHFVIQTKRTFFGLSELRPFYKARFMQPVPRGRAQGG